MTDNRNQVKDRPLFKDFIKNYLIPFTDKGSKNFVENKLTVYISYFVLALYGIILFLILDGKYIIINSSFDFVKCFIIAYSIGVLLEIIHWFYARFDKVEPIDTSR